MAVLLPCWPDSLRAPTLVWLRFRKGLVGAKLMAKPATIRSNNRRARAICWPCPAAPHMPRLPPMSDELLDSGLKCPGILLVGPPAMSRSVATTSDCLARFLALTVQEFEEPAYRRAHAQGQQAHQIRFRHLPVSRREPALHGLRGAPALTAAATSAGTRKIPRCLTSPASSSFRLRSCARMTLDGEAHSLDKSGRYTMFFFF